MEINLLKQKDITIIINYESNLTLSFELEAYIKTILTITEFKKGLFEFTFINDTKMIELNQNYFNKNESTDIITFNLNSVDEPHSDIYICTDEAQRNATEFNKSFAEEIQLLIIHGILHIKGYEDYDDHSRSIMFKEQDRILKEVANL